MRSEYCGLVAVVGERGSGRGGGRGVPGVPGGVVGKHKSPQPGDVAEWNHREKYPQNQTV